MDNMVGFTEERNLSGVTELSLDALILEKMQRAIASNAHQTKLQGAEIETVKNKVEYLESEQPISRRSQLMIKKACNEFVTSVLGGKKAPAYQDRSLRSKVYARAWEKFKQKFIVTSYLDTPKKYEMVAINFFDNCKIDADLIAEIEVVNGQISLEV